MAMFDKATPAEIRANWQFVRRVGRLYLVPIVILIAAIVGVVIYAHGWQDGIEYVLANKESRS